MITNLTDPPTLTLDEEKVRVQVGADLRLGCSIEAFPAAVMSWASEENRAITKGKYQGEIIREIEVSQIKFLNFRNALK